MLKTQPQAILMAPLHHKAIEAGEKRLTIREGVRDVRNGPALLCCPIASWCVSVDVVNVHYQTIRNLNASTRKAYGVETASDVVETLKPYYPDITPDNVVTVIEFELNQRYPKYTNNQQNERALAHCVDNLTPAGWEAFREEVELRR